MSDKLQKFDVSDYLSDEESIAEYLNAAMEEGDQALLMAAIADVARATGMQAIAQQSGLGRESLYKALAPGAKPRFETVFKILQALGVRLTMNAQH
ncbi:addiction module antidote protein [Endozoicomonas sp.]|uniref:addiction module antidote protein n=1 Tax=Endozoicomonas sp. TaxID=1892382 RepID=UPI003839D868